MTHIFWPSRRRMLDVLAATLILVPASKALAQSLSTLKIATIGAGNEGGALGTIFAKRTLRVTWQHLVDFLHLFLPQFDGAIRLFTNGREWTDRISIRQPSTTFTNLAANLKKQLCHLQHCPVTILVRTGAGHGAETAGLSIALGHGAAPSRRPGMVIV